MVCIEWFAIADKIEARNIKEWFAIADLCSVKKAWTMKLALKFE
jgi:hypothetical protein